jgi:hypothetical protein
MATVTETMENTTIEAAKIAQDAARRHLDESTAVGRTYFSSRATAAQAGIRVAFDLQNAMIQASRTMMDASTQANRAWFDQTAEMARKNQDTTAKLITAGLDVAGSAIPKARG